MATITVVCPHCGSRMRASTDHVGRRGKCSSCMKMIEIRPSGDAPVAELHPTAAPGRARRTTQATDVPVWLAGLIGAAVTVLFYLFVSAFLRQTYTGDLFLKRGPVPYAIMLVTFWGLAILAMKYRAVKMQLSYAELELELIPLEVGVQITPANVDQFLQHLDGLPKDQQESILARRLHGALEHFKSRTSVPEVSNYLTSQAEIDASGVDAGYILLRAFIWVIPILGFIGTVMGISDAVNALAVAMTQEPAAAVAPAQPGAAVPAADAAKPTDLGQRLMGGMKGVIGGLATAFDTTFVGLLMTIVLLFPTESLRKTEYSVLDRIEGFTNESLLRRMTEKRELSGEEMPEVVRGALESAFHEHQRWLAQWQMQVAELCKVIGGEFEAMAAQVQERLAGAHREGADEARAARQAVEELFRALQQQTETWQRSGQTAQGVQEAVRSAEKVAQALAGMSGQMLEVVEQQQRMLKSQSAADLGTVLGELRREVARLADRLGADGAAPTNAVVVTASPGGLLGRLLGRRK